MRVGEGEPSRLVQPGAVVLARRVEFVEEGVVDDSADGEKSVGNSEVESAGEGNGGEGVRRRTR